MNIDTLAIVLSYIDDENIIKTMRTSKLFFDTCTRCKKINNIRSVISGYTKRQLKFCAKDIARKAALKGNYDAFVLACEKIIDDSNIQIYFKESGVYRKCIESGHTDILRVGLYKFGNVSCRGFY